MPSVGRRTVGRTIRQPGRPSPKTGAHLLAADGSCPAAAERVAPPDDRTRMEGQQRCGATAPSHVLRIWPAFPPASSMRSSPATRVRATSSWTRSRAVARLRSRPARKAESCPGNDLNPLAHILTAAKVDPPTKADVKTRLVALRLAWAATASEWNGNRRHRGRRARFGRDTRAGLRQRPIGG